MGDIVCKNCGEPWEYYAVKHDIKDGIKILEGEGCPVCYWGETEEPKDYTSDWLNSLEKNTDEDPLKYM